jgi:hypothetical protein
LVSDTDVKVKEAERQIDAFFDAQTRIKGLYKPAVIDALLERAELLVTGHRSSGERYEQAITALRFNACEGLNWSLRAAKRLCSDRKSRVRYDLDQIALECISDGMSYAFVEDAFYSSWKGYASATFPAEHELLFRPTGSTLDARLRRFRTNDDVEKPTRETRPNFLLDPDSPTAQRFVESLMEKSKVVKGHGFVWSVADEVIREVAEVFSDFISSSLESVTINLGSISLDQLASGMGIICAVCQIHSLVSILSADDPSDLASGFNWPALFRKRIEWVRWFELLGVNEQVLATLMLNFEDTSSDVAITPLVPIDSEYLGVVPSIMLHSNWPRNLVALLARKFNPAYSAYSISKEDVLLKDLKQRFPGLVRGTKIRLPNWKGQRLPDIDAILGEPQSDQIVIAEVKWLLSASSTKDVIARNDNLKKGTRQLMLIKEFLMENPTYLRERGIITGRRQDMTFLLLCKGHLGNEDVIGPGMTMSDYNTFKDYLGTSGLKTTIERLGQYDYLPVEGRDFTVDVMRQQLGQWILGWSQVHPMALPPDEETDALEELCMITSKYIPMR